MSKSFHGKVAHSLIIVFVIITFLILTITLSLTIVNKQPLSPADTYNKESGGITPGLQAENTPPAQEDSNLEVEAGGAVFDPLTARPGEKYQGMILERVLPNVYAPDDTSFDKYKFSAIFSGTTTVLVHRRFDCGWYECAKEYYCFTIDPSSEGMIPFENRFCLGPKYWNLISPEKTTFFFEITRLHYNYCACGLPGSTVEIISSTPVQ